MSPDKTRLLYETFPILYRGRYKPIEDSLMSWGFCCDDGWFDLVWELSAEIERIAKSEGREPDSESWPEALQVKEKLGTLRYYLSPSTQSDALRAAIDAARAKTERDSGNYHIASLSGGGSEVPK